MTDELLQGALALLRAPLALAACIAAPLATAPALRWFHCAALVGAGAALAAVPAPPLWTLTGSAIAVAGLGLVAALRWQPPLHASWWLAALGGAAASWAADLPWASWPELAGGACLAAAVSALTGAIVQQALQRIAVARIGMAIAGAWIATLAMLMLLLAVRAA